MSKKKSLDFLFQQFERGVYSAFEEFTSTYELYDQGAIGREFVAFSMYDNDQKEFKRHDSKKTPAILWEHIHSSFSDILRKLLKPYSYLGFGVLLYLKHLELGAQSCHLVVDAPLKGNENTILEGSRYNFKEAIPLTAVCFNIGEDEEQNQSLTPIVFHWRNPDFKTSSQDTLRKTMYKVSDITVSCPIPKTNDGNLLLKYTEVGLRESIKVRGVLKKKIFFERLKRFHRKYRPESAKNHVSKKDLEKRFAWAVSFFAYVFEKNLKYHHKSSGHNHIEELKILFVPSTFSPQANSALLVPLQIADSEINEVIEKVLLISRAIALPIEEAQPLVKYKSSEWEKKGAEISAAISGHEAGAQLASMKNLMPYVGDEDLGETAKDLIFGSINYVHLYLSDNPGTSEIKDFYLNTGDPLKTWIKKIAKLSWKIALAREIRDVEIDTKLLLDLKELLLETNMPEIKFLVDECLYFHPSINIEKNYPYIRPTISRWILASLSNSMKWSGQIENGKNIYYWIKKKSKAFKSIKIEVSQNKGEQTVKLAILNKYHYKERNEKLDGTQRVLEVINKDLPLGGSFKFEELNGENKKEWETSIILVGGVFKFAVNKE